MWDLKIPYRKSTNQTNEPTTLRAEGNWEVGIPSCNQGEVWTKLPGQKESPVIRSDKIRPQKFNSSHAYSRK